MHDAATMRSRIATRLLALVLAGVLAACASTPPAPPRPDTPAGNAEVVISPRWWTAFADPALNALVDEALASNLDLALATARVDEARAQLAIARSFLFPEVSLGAGGGRQQLSRTTGPQPIPGGGDAFNSFGVGLNAAYEVDLWGRVRSGRNAAGELLAASAFDRDAITLSVAAEVARAYFTLVSADAELLVLRDTLATRDEAVELQRERYGAGVSSEFELRSAEAERATVVADIAIATRVQKTIASALATLLGRSPRDVYVPAIGRSDVARAAATVPPVPAGLPSDLLAQRPDVRRREAQLAAAHYRVDEARAQFFPSIVLTGAYGSESAALGSLFSGPAAVWALAAGLTQPIFAGGRIVAQTDEAKARRDQATVAYLQTVQTAFREAHDAFVAYSSARDGFAAQTERRDRLTEALALAELRYKSGYSPYLEVLDAQRGLLRAETDRIIAARELRSAIVDINKSLGGGWQPPLQDLQETAPLASAR